MPAGGKPPRDIEADIWYHLNELALRAKRSLIAFFTATVILAVAPASLDFSNYVPLVKVLPNILLENVVPERVSFMDKTYNITIVQVNPFSGLNILLKSALLLGLLGASPVIAREVFEFVRPALYPHEERIITRLSAASIALFGVGAVIAYFIIAPLAFRIMFLTTAIVAGERELLAFADIEKLFTMTIQLIVATGFAFEAPLIVYLLVANGIVDVEYFKGDRLKMIFIGSLIIGALISPDPTGLGMLLIGVPYFLMIFIAARLGERALKARQEKAKQEWIKG